MRNSIFINIQTIPLLKQVEKRDCKSESHLEIRPDSLPEYKLATEAKGSFQPSSGRSMRRADRFSGFAVADFASGSATYPYLQSESLG